MKKLSNLLSYVFLFSASLFFMLFFSNCNEKKPIDLSSTVAIPDSQMEKLMEYAVDLEYFGKPEMKTSTDSDSINSKISSQNFRFKVFVDENDNPIPIEEGQSTALRQPSGTVGVTGTVNCIQLCVGKKCKNEGCSSATSPPCVEHDCGSCAGLCIKWTSGTAFGSIRLIQ